MAKAFIASAINLNTDLQESLTCVIHRGLLIHPMILPCKSKHRLCLECTRQLIGESHQISCPLCRESIIVPVEWNTAWFDRVLHNITSTLSTSEADINQKVTRFVQDSYARYNQSEQQLRIKSIQLVSNPRLKTEFDKCKRELGSHEVTTLLHGTTRKAALSISGQGFRIPSNFQRSEQDINEGELKFGKAIYFGEAKKATEYGENTLVLADCILGRIQEKNESELQLTPSDVHARGYHTIHYYDKDNGLVNQEWAIYKSEQCYPLCIIDYEFLDANRLSEEALVKQIKSMNHSYPTWEIIYKGLMGTDNQCKEALRFIGDAGKNLSSKASTLMHSLLSCLSQNKINSLLKHPNETIRILFLRALWQTGRLDNNVQLDIQRTVDWSLLTESLHSGYADISWRACGVIANMAAVVIPIRPLLTSCEILNQLTVVLKRAVQFEDKICILTILNLLANVAASQYTIMKHKTDILNYVNQNLLDHHDEQIQEAGNRLFCNIIGKGTLSIDWQRGGYKATQMAPPID